MAQEIDGQVIETRLGKRCIDPSRILHFPRGLIGFELEREFTLLQIRESSPFLVLQSMHDERLGLMVADPFAFIPDFEVRIDDAEQRILGMQSAREAAVLVTVSIPPGRPERTALGLTGPIVINTISRVGLQVAQTQGRYPSQVLLSELGQGLSPDGPKDQGQK